MARVLRGDVLAHLEWIEIQGIGIDVDEHRLGPPQDHGIGRRYKGEGGHDDLIAWAEITQHGGHLERGCARMRHQRLAGACKLADFVLALLRVGPIPGQLTKPHCVADVFNFITYQTRLIEWDLLHPAFPM